MFLPFKLAVCLVTMFPTRLEGTEPSLAVPGTEFVLRLTLKSPNKIAADDILSFYFYLPKKIRLDFFT